MEHAFSTQAQECMTKLQQACGQSQTAMQESLAAAQAAGARVLNQAVALGQAGAQQQLKCAEALSRSAMDAMAHVTTAARAQAEVCTQFPSDPVGTAQRLLAGSLEASRKSLEIGTGAVQAYLQALSGACGELAKAGQETTAIVAETAQKIQGIAHQTISAA
jgi:hypothetical protein